MEGGLDGPCRLEIRSRSKDGSFPGPVSRIMKLGGVGTRLLSLNPMDDRPFTEAGRGGVQRTVALVVTTELLPQCVPYQHDAPERMSCALAEMQCHGSE